MGKGEARALGSEPIAPDGACRKTLAGDENFAGQWNEGPLDEAEQRMRLQAYERRIKWRRTYLPNQGFPWTASSVKAK